MLPQTLATSSRWVDWLCTYRYSFVTDTECIA